MVTLNDSHWFGPSNAGMQQLEMATFRTLEHQKPMLYVSNTGPSAIISGEQAFNLLAMHQMGHIDATLHPRQGMTPYARYGFNLLHCVGY